MKADQTLQIDPFLSFDPLEQILNGIKQEYKRIQKRKHLDGGYQQSECCYSPESPSQSSTMNVSSMTGWFFRLFGGIFDTKSDATIISILRICLIYKQGRAQEASLQIEKNSHYSPSDKLEWSANACWKKGKKRCGKSMRRPWLQNWQVGSFRRGDTTNLKKNKPTQHARRYSRWTAQKNKSKAISLGTLQLFIIENVLSVSFLLLG